MLNNNSSLRSASQPGSPINYRGSVQNLPSKVKISFIKKSSSQEKLPPFIIPHIIRQNSLIHQKCLLCEQFHGKSQIGTISTCDHIFCTACLHRYCIYKIDVMQDVTCPQEGCKMQLQPNSKVFEELPQNTKDKYSRNILWKQTISNPNLKLCPREHCQGVIDKSQPINECNRCRTKYCKDCELVIHEGACDTNFQDNFKDWKRCPQCKMFIERTQGCNHMTCRCGHQFCFVCLAVWSDSHYECGNQNFHNRFNELSVWQRFLFGLLIIVAYPIFVVIFVPFWLLSIVLAAICGFFGGPVYFYVKYQCLQNAFCALFCPLYLVLGSLLGIIVIFAFGIYVFGQTTVGLLMNLRALWCNCNQAQQPDFLVQEIEL